MCFPDSSPSQMQPRIALTLFTGNTVGGIVIASPAERAQSARSFLRAGLQKRDADRLEGHRRRAVVRGAVRGPHAGQEGPPGAHDDRPCAVTGWAAALGGKVGGIAVIRPRDGAVTALAGLAVSVPQPPGSTFRSSRLPLRSSTASPPRRPRIPSDRRDAVGSRAAQRRRRGLRRDAAGGVRGIVQLGVRSARREARRRRLVAAARAFGFNEETRIRRRRRAPSRPR